MVVKARLAGALALPAVVALFPLGGHADMAKGLEAYVRADYGAALAEFSPAARAGDPEAQAMMGRFYAMGLGVPQDLVRAWAWDDRAARGGNADANAARAGIEAILTPTQLAEARRLAGSTGAPPGALPPVPIIDTGVFPPIDSQAPVRMREERLANGMPAVDGAAASDGGSPRRMDLVPPQTAGR